jgi:phenylalanyl-tRNA synthetase alpha chain
MTKPTLEELKKLQNEAVAGLAQISTSADLEDWRVRYLGRKGAVPMLLRGVKELSLEDRRIFGEEANKIRRDLEQLYAEKLAVVEVIKENIDGKVENTTDQVSGHLHPLTLTIRRIENIFSDMGFTIAEGPLVEDPEYNFDLLNIPLEHPARAATDTFYVEGGHVLRTHTSPVQLRSVLENNLRPPFRIFSPGRTFRAEKTDVSHDATFHQFEGLVVSDTITIANFKSVIEEFYSRFFDKKVVTRLRPSFFPFVEPGFEVDISCVFCQGKGCRVCKQSGWIEIMGAGMVHPNVLRNMNIDPAKYQGFAFGGAIDRIAMLRHDIPDIRLFWSGDLKFLRQFS